MWPRLHCRGARCVRAAAVVTWCESLCLDSPTAEPREGESKGVVTRPRDLRRGRAAPICGGRAPSGGQTGRTTRLGSSEFCFKLRDLWCHLGLEKMGTALCCKHQMLYWCTYKGRHSESSVRTHPRGFSALFSSLSRERLIAPQSRLTSLFSPSQKRCTGNKFAGFYTQKGVRMSLSSKSTDPWLSSSLSSRYFLQNISTVVVKPPWVSAASHDLPRSHVSTKGHLRFQMRWLGRRPVSSLGVYKTGNSRFNYLHFTLIGNKTQARVCQAHWVCSCMTARSAVWKQLLCERRSYQRLFYKFDPFVIFHR